MNLASPDALLDRIRAEYLEMPGLQLKLEQVQRFCGVERALCEQVLQSLVDQKFLYLSANAQYARFSGGEVARPRTAKAAIRDERLLPKAS